MTASAEPQVAPDGPANDEALYNAGATYESDAAISAAIGAYERLLKLYPNSKLAPKALARVGKLYGDIAMYDRAADKLETYAKKYAGEKDALDAMSDAVYFRKALGDREKAIEDTSYFIKTFAAKRPADAANAMWSLTELYKGEPDSEIKHLRAYVRQFGTKGGAERVSIAYAMIGQLLWTQSCPVPQVDGLCVKPTTTRRSCGPASAVMLSPIKRDVHLVKDALASFASAIDRYEPASADANARYYYAQSKLALADAELDAYLALAFPRGLDFDAKKREASVKRFSQWLEQKTQAGAKLQHKYDDVFPIKDTASSITAAERSGLLAQSLANAMVTAEIPRDVQRGPHARDKIDAFCDAMTVAAEPLQTRAREAFTVCLTKSTELSWFGDSSRQCERELTHSDPETFPQLSELRGAPVVSALTATEPPPR